MSAAVAGINRQKVNTREEVRVFLVRMYCFA